jgi:hypothetical protein
MQQMSRAICGRMFFGKKIAQKERIWPVSPLPKNATKRGDSGEFRHKTMSLKEVE